MSEEKNKGGRPLKFKTVEILQKKIDAYFADCDPHLIEVTEFILDPVLKEYLQKVVSRMSDQKPYTITGLALALDTSRETLLEYQGLVEGRKKKDKYADAIKKAKLRCQNYAESHLFSGKNATGAIFNLKNNYKWRDESVVNQRHTMSDLLDEIDS